MSQPLFKDADEMRRHLRGHVQSLRAAGVELLATGPSVNPSFEVTETSSNCAATSVGETSDQQESPDNRRQALQVLADEVKGCTRCPELASTRTQTVFADGSAQAELCFIGEAPGADEDAQGLPFVGVAGQLLNKIISACGLRRDEVYICNILKCRPPGNRTPLPSEAANCRGFLERQLELVRPKFIVALGGCAATNLLQTASPLGKLRGRFHDWHGIPVMVTYHPAYLLPHRSPEKKKDVWEDMKMLLKRMGRPVPGR